jgi:hypothetical protein
VGFVPHGIKTRRLQRVPHSKESLSDAWFYDAMGEGYAAEMLAFEVITGLP